MRSSVSSFLHFAADIAQVASSMAVNWYRPGPDLARIHLHAITWCRPVVAFRLVTCAFACRQNTESLLHEHFVNRRRGKPHAMQPMQFVTQPLSRQAAGIDADQGSPLAALHPLSGPENDKAVGLKRVAQLRLRLRIDAIAAGSLSPA